mmetsp:Transcript_22585/g.58886  ORF Transcript_22585/g.58886 Transcript_22585/m.58886 type:complete len:183 (-) Transcript_22585:86-634(-)
MAGTTVCSPAFRPGFRLTRTPGASRSANDACLQRGLLLSRAPFARRGPGADTQSTADRMLRRGFDSLRNHPSFDKATGAKREQTEHKPDGGKPAGGTSQAKERAGAVVRVQATRSGRGGKTVTVISGLPAGEMSSLAKSLKAKCGSGGKVRGADLELQGDHTAKLVQLLQELGFKNTKKSGG